MDRLIVFLCLILLATTMHGQAEIQKTVELRFKLERTDIKVFNLDKPKLLMTLNDEAIDYEDIYYLVKRFRKNNEKNKIAITVEADDDVPYLLLSYLELHLAACKVNRIHYLKDDRKIVANTPVGTWNQDCKDLGCPEESCYTSPFLHLAESNLISKHQLNPVFNPPYVNCTTSTKNFMTMSIYPIYKLSTKINNQINSVPRDSIGEAITQIWDQSEILHGNPFFLKISGSVPFSEFFEVQYELQEWTQNLKEDSSRAMYDLPHKELNRKQKSDMRLKTTFFSVGIIRP